MARNKLVCALSKAVVVIESGPERDAQGKMSGTFNAAKTALSMGLPLFVLTPDCLDNAPEGNAALIALGGYSLNPTDGAKKLLNVPLSKQQILFQSQITILLSKYHTFLRISSPLIGICSLSLARFQTSTAIAYSSKFDSS